MKTAPKHTLDASQTRLFHSRGRPYYLAHLISEHMPQGTVKFFNDDKGYGFITPDEGGKDVFVHIKSCNGEIAENDVVTYEVEETQKGLNAINVSVA